MSFSTYYGDKINDHMFRNQAFTAPSAVWASLHSADPGLIGSNEISGSAYVRQQVSLNASSSKSTASASTITFAGMPGGNVLYAGLWAGGFGGSFLVSGSLSASKITNSGDSFVFNAGNFVITLT
jgi:hypothetical protein